MIGFDDYTYESKAHHDLKWPYIPDHPYRILSTRLKHFNDAKTFIECSNDMQDVYKNIVEYNSGKKRKVLIFFDDMIAVWLIIKN